MLCRSKSLDLTVHRGSRVGRRIAEGVGDEVTVLAGVSCEVAVLAGVFREVTVLAGVTRDVDVRVAVVVVSGMVRRSRLCVNVAAVDVSLTESVVPTSVDDDSAVLAECVVVTSAAVDDVTSVAMVVSTLLPCVDDVIARAVVVDWTVRYRVVVPSPVVARVVAGDVTGRWLTDRGSDSDSVKHTNSVTKCVI